MRTTYLADKTKRKKLADRLVMLFFGITNRRGRLSRHVLRHVLTNLLSCSNDIRATSYELQASYELGACFRLFQVELG